MSVDYALEDNCGGSRARTAHQSALALPSFRESRNSGCSCFQSGEFFSRVKVRFTTEPPWGGVFGGGGPHPYGKLRLP